MQRYTFYLICNYFFIFITINVTDYAFTSSMKTQCISNYKAVF